MQSGGMSKQINQDKLSILKMIESDDFNLLTSKELESTYELFTANWEHDEHTNQSKEEYIATFPEFPNKRSRDSAIANYGRINAKLRVIGFAEKRQTRENTFQMRMYMREGSVFQRIQHALLMRMPIIRSK
jgi:hypothetical protein